MPVSNVFHTGRSALGVTKAAIATAGHNIANAGTEGFSRQRVVTSAEVPNYVMNTVANVGMGARISKVERLNDEYLERQIRNAGRDMCNLEEKDLVLRQTEDVFNEMGGEGLNRLISTFFNEFRKLANEPENEAVRQAVREASTAVVSDFRRIRHEIDNIRSHIDSRIEGYTNEVNSLCDEIKELNTKIQVVEVGNGSPNDLMDKRDIALKKLGSYMDLSMHKGSFGTYDIDVKGLGPLIAGSEVQKFSVYRSPADDKGKPENAVDLKTTSSANAVVTHRIESGKIGALLEARDKTLSSVLNKLDELAYVLSGSVNAIHEQGFSKSGEQGISYFRPLDEQFRAAEFIDISDEVKHNINNIATAAEPDSPGDNRIAVAISGIQGQKLMNDGKASLDDWYNSIVSDIGITASKNRSGMNQQKDILTQLNKMRDQISGVSIDEETADLMQYQHMFDASAKVIQVADEMLKTVLEMRR